MTLERTVATVAFDIIVAVDTIVAFIPLVALLASSTVMLRK
jgi:hypothetical protein